MGRACVLLLQGRWGESLRLHAFAPLLLMALAVLGAGLLLRGHAREGLREAIRGLENRFRLSQVLLAGLIIYWLLRLMLDAAQWRMLVS